MFKKKKIRGFLAAATTTAVVGGMVALGSPAAATLVRTANPSVIGCGLPITLVLDASGSIEQGAERNAVKAASIAFLDGLADTSSSARIIQFSTTSEQLSARLPVAGNDLTTLKQAITTKYYTGVGGNMTNWEMPLWQTSTETPTPLADGLVVFVTDGDPNTIGGFEGKAVSYPPTEDAAADAAMVYANDLKADGNRVIAVGVGVSGSASQARLTKISGDVIKTSIAPTDTINSFDVLIPANFDNLATALKSVAAALCGGSITVTKYTDPGGQWTTTPGVQIAATVSGATYGQDYLWSQPAGTTTPTAVTSTDSNGVTQMQYNPAVSWPQLAPQPTVRITELLQSGYSPRDYTCTFNGLTQRANQQGSLTVSGNEAYFEVAALSADQSMSCEIYNRGHGWLTLAKDVRGKGDPAAWTLTATPVAPIDGQQPVTGNGDPNSNGGVQQEQVYAGTYQLAEEGGLANYTSLGWDCESDEPGDNLSAADVGDTVTIAAGESWTCTVTNVRDTASLTLVKTVSGSSVKADAFTLSATAQAPDAELNFSAAGGAGTVHEVWAATPYALSETGPSGYTAGDWICTAAPRNEAVPVEQGKVTLKKGQQVTCSLVNTRDTSSLMITKEFNPLTSGYSGTFDIAYSCVEGTDPVKSGTVKLAAGQQASVEGLPVGTVCTVTEPALPTNPSGWTFNAPTFSPGDGKATVVKGSAATVTVVNSISQVSPVKVKQPCPVTPKLVTPKPKVAGNQILIKKMSTNSKCTMSKPVVLCRPMVSTAAGETAFCKTSVSKKGKVTVKTAGYDAVRVTVKVKATPKPGSVDSWTPKVWRQKWTLR